MPEIQMAGGCAAMVDECDYASMMAYRWHRHSKGYASCSYRVQGRTVNHFMHRLIMCPPPGTEVDHINGNKLDNRRSNLRVCTRSENSRNARPWKRLGQTSRFKGVRMHPKRKKWEAYIRIGGVQKYLGHYFTEIEAAEAYNRAASEAFGPFARLNSIGEAA